MMGVVVSKNRATLGSVACVWMCLVLGAGPAWAAIEVKLVPVDGQPDDYFGRAVAVAGDIAVIGADHDDDMGIDSGSAYIYRLMDSVWVQEAKALPLDGETNTRFAWAVATDGTSAVFGAHHDNDQGIDSGSAYVFALDGASWVQQAKLLASDGGPSDNFGRAVAVAGSVAVIGAKGTNDNGPNAGSVYIFRRSGSNWHEETKLVASDGESGDLFGWSVAISGDTVLVGAAADDEKALNAGAAYVFQYENGTWRQKLKLMASDGEAEDWFGASVAISGDRAIVGAHQDDDMGEDSGSAYIFHWDELDWVEQDKLVPLDAMPEDNFGWSVSISGDAAGVGAYLAEESGSDAGTAYVYWFDGAEWLPQIKLTASDASAGDNFGVSVSLTNAGEHIIVGAMFDDDNGGDSGSAYVFGDQWRCRGDLDLDGTRDLTDFGLFTAAYGSQASEPRYDLSADLDSDGVVDLTDFGLFAADYGVPCP